MSAKPANDWQLLPRSERATVGRFDCDVWPVGGGARYSVMERDSGRYVKGGQCADISWAKEVSSNFAQSLRDLEGQP